MGMLLAWSNLLDSTSLSTDSEVATLPVTNLRHPYLSRQWRTSPGVTSAYVRVDCLAAAAVDVLALTGTNLTPAATLRLRASTSDATALAGDLFDSGVVNAGVKAAYKAVYYALASTVTARYWRLDLDDATVAEDQLRLGRGWLGPAWRPSENREYGWGKVSLDLSRRSTSRSGAEFVDFGARPRSVSFSLNFMSGAEMRANAWELGRVAGISRDVLAVFEPDGAYVSEDSVLGLVDRAEPLVEENARVWRMRYQITERVNHHV